MTGVAMRRGPVTWYCYLSLGFFTYLLNIQGNILPFLKDELGLSYRAVSLHSSAIALGLIAVGLGGDRIIRRYGRRRALRLSTAGISAGAVLLCMAPAAWASIGSCALMGALGGLIPALVPAVLAETHGPGGRDVAYAEANAITYAFGILGPLTTALLVALAVGWRGAVVLGAAFGAAILTGFRNTRVPDPAGAARLGQASLPAPYWAYWALIGAVVALEFCVLIWAPAFLERVAGLPRATAAGSAAAFSLAMLLGRAGTNRLVRLVATPHLFLGALLLAVLGFLVYWGAARPLATIAGLFVLGLGGGTAMALGMPARSPLMAQVVGPEQVTSAMAMSNSAMNVTRLFGPAVAGAMAGIWNLDSVYLTQAALYVVSCALLLFVPTGIGHVAAQQRGNMFREIANGLSYVARDSRLRSLNLSMLAISFFAMPYVMLLAGFVKEDLGKGDGAFGILQSVSGLGALVGSLGVATLTTFDRKPLVQLVSGVVGGAGLILLALASRSFGYSGAIAAILVLGLSLTAYQTLNSTLLMDSARPEFYGRVMSISMLSFSAMPLMAFPLGQVADSIGVTNMFIAQGGIVVGCMALIAIFNPGHTFGRTSPILLTSNAAPPDGPILAMPGEEPLPAGGK